MVKNPPNLSLLGIIHNKYIELMNKRSSVNKWINDPFDWSKYPNDNDPNNKQKETNFIFFTKVKVNEKPHPFNF